MLRRVYHGRSLMARAGATRTFATLLTPLTAALALAGLYLLDDAINYPLRSDSTEVLIGSVLVAYALILSVYLLRRPSLRAEKPPRKATPRKPAKPVIVELSLCSIQRRAEPERKPTLVYAGVRAEHRIFDWS